MFQARSEEIKQRVQQLIARYEAAHPGQRVPSIDIRFDLRGRAAGMAGCRGWSTYYMRFNRDMMLNESWDHVIKDTVPHELAHIICFAQNSDRGHGPAWRRVCQELGGSGARYHQEAVVYARGRTYEYTTSTGQTINLSESKHRRIQQGQYYTGRHGLGRIDRTCSYRVIGELSAAAPAATPRSLPNLAPVPTKAVPVHTLLPKSVAPTESVEASSPSKADRVRARIAEAKARGESPDTVVRWAQLCLAMTAALARTYVKNNWSKV